MNELLVGLCIGTGIMWGWMMWRLLFERYVVANAPDAIRRKGWLHFNRFLLVMGFAIAFLIVPEHIMVTQDRIDVYDGRYLSTLAAALFLGAGIMIHHGLDIVAEKPPNTVRIYFIIAILSIGYSFLGSVL